MCLSLWLSSSHLTSESDLWLCSWMVAKEAEGTVPLSAAINLQPRQGVFYSPSPAHSPFKPFPKLDRPKHPQMKKRKKKKRTSERWNRMCVGWGRRKTERRRKCWGHDSKVEWMDWWMNEQGCELELGKEQDNSAVWGHCLWPSYKFACVLSCILWRHAAFKGAFY